MDTKVRKGRTKTDGADAGKERKGKRRRGRPEKPLKIDDTPRNVARSLFGLPPLKDE